MHALFHRSAHPHLPPFIKPFVRFRLATATTTLAPCAATIYPPSCTHGLHRMKITVSDDCVSASLPREQPEITEQCTLARRLLTSLRSCALTRGELEDAVKGSIQFPPSIPTHCTSIFQRLKGRESSPNPLLGHGNQTNKTLARCRIVTQAWWTCTIARSKSRQQGIKLQP